MCWSAYSAVGGHLHFDGMEMAPLHEIYEHLSQRLWALSCALGRVFGRTKGFSQHFFKCQRQRFSRRVIAPWLAGKLLKTKDAVRLTPGGLGTVGCLLG